MFRKNLVSAEIFDELRRWHRWYAWYPVRLVNGHWVWLEPLWRKYRSGFFYHTKMKDRGNPGGYK